MTRLVKSVLQKSWNALTTHVIPDGGFSRRVAFGSRSSETGRDLAPEF